MPYRGHAELADCSHRDGLLWQGYTDAVSPDAPHGWPAERRCDAGAAFVNHLATDDLIGVGFAGQGGIGEASPFARIAADPPPMTRDQMVAAAQRWVGEGHAKCGANGWDGVITSTTTAQAHADSQPGTLLVKDPATELNVTLAVVDSTASANVTFTQHDFTDAPKNSPCWIIHDSWQADGRAAGAEVQIIGDTDQA